MIRRLLCGWTPWTPHEYVMGRHLLLLFEVTCVVCGDHSWGHEDHRPLLPWRPGTEAYFRRALSARSGAAGEVGDG